MWRGSHIFFGADCVSCATDRQSSNGLNDGEATAVLLAASIAVSVLVFIYLRWFELFGLRTFFGLGTDKKLLFVFSTIEVSENSKLSKTVLSGENQPRFVRATPFYEPRTTRVVQEALEQQPRLQGDAKYLTDEDVLPTPAKEPDAAKQKGRVIVALGSSSTNRLCEWLMSQDSFRSQPDFYSFVRSKTENLDDNDNGFRLHRNGGATEGARIPPILNNHGPNDYGVLLKHTCDGTTYFLCAGIDKYGTENTVRYLFKKWHALRKRVGQKDFYILYETSKDSRDLKELVIGVKRDSTHNNYELLSVDPNVLTF